MTPWHGTFKCEKILNIAKEIQFILNFSSSKSRLVHLWYSGDENVYPEFDFNIENYIDVHEKNCYLGSVGWYIVDTEKEEGFIISSTDNLYLYFKDFKKISILFKKLGISQMSTNLDEAYEHLKMLISELKSENKNYIKTPRGKVFKSREDELEYYKENRR